MKRINSLFKNASVFVLAFFVQAFVTAQGLTFQEAANDPAENDNYIQPGSTRNFYIVGEKDGLNEDSIAGYRIKTDNLKVKINKPAFLGFSVTPRKAGPAHMTAIIRLTNGSKVRIHKKIQVVELPELCLEVSTSSPDHSFIWLKLRDVATGNDVSNDYQLYMMHFDLRDTTGKIKTSGVVGLDRLYFPSVSLKEYAHQFEVGDQLTVELSIIHKEYGLLTYVAPTTITIETLWH